MTTPQQSALYRRISLHVAPNTWTAIAGLSVAASGIFTALPIFWAAFSQTIDPRHAAVAIAAVNSVGNLGGFLGPYATGWLLRVTHGYASGLFATGLCLSCGALLAFLSMKSPTPATPNPA